MLNPPGLVPFCLLCLSPGRRDNAGPGPQVSPSSSVRAKPDNAVGTGTEEEKEEQEGEEDGR